MKHSANFQLVTFSILMSLEPAAASICALIFLEHLAFNEIVAVVFCVIASVGSTLTTQSQT
jgi:inner membrane transporter RhtA